MNLSILEKQAVKRLNANLTAFEKKRVPLITKLESVAQKKKNLEEELERVTQLIDSTRSTILNILSKSEVQQSEDTTSVIVDSFSDVGITQEECLEQISPLIEEEDVPVRDINNEEDFTMFMH